MYNKIYSTIKEFMEWAESNTYAISLVKNWNGKRGPRRRLSLAKVLTLNIMRYLLHVKDLKAFHRLISSLGIVPELPNYENFLKASNKALPVMTLFLQVLLEQNRRLNRTGIHFMDSTPVTTCLNRRIFSHKVTNSFASRGKSTKGWFYGLKLHGVCTESGVLESVFFTSGNVSDCSAVEKVTENLYGKFYADAGYLKKKDELRKLAQTGRYICCATRKNMKRLISEEQWSHIRKRNIIETVWGVMKQNFFLEYHQARNMTGLFRHYVSAISAYILECRLKSIQKLKTRI